MGLFGNELIKSENEKCLVEMDIFINSELYNKLLSKQSITESGILLESGGAVNLIYNFGRNKNARLFIRSQDSGGYSDKDINHGPAYKIKTINGVDAEPGNKLGVEVKFNIDPPSCEFYIPKNIKQPLKNAHRNISRKYPELLEFGLQNANILMNIWKCTNELEFNNLINQLMKNNPGLFWRKE